MKTNTLIYGLKTMMLAAILFLASSAVGYGQDGRYTAAMQKGLAMMDSAKVAEQYIAAANYFERIAAAETTQWLPAYYAAYNNLIAGISSQEKEKKDALMDKALAFIKIAEEKAPGNSEIWTIKGYTEFMKMSIDPSSRLDLMSKASASLGKAKALDPENPRPWFVEGQNTFYTPEAFGGGKKSARPLLEAAVMRYEKAKNQDKLVPSWGKERCIQLLEQSK